jgi:hypothetical protein
MANDNDVVELEPTDPAIADLGDDPIDPPESDTPDENEGDAYRDAANTTQRDDDPSFENED